jgi:hypothetical protein
LARPAENGNVTVPVDANAVGAPLRLAFEQPADRESTTAEIWLHNGTLAAVGPLAPRCGPLTAPDGGVLVGAEVRFDPSEVDLLPPRSSRAVAVSLAAAKPLRTGIYRGTIQADGAPKLWLPVEVAVEPC